MGPLVPLLAVGAGIGYLAFSKPSAATPSGAAAAAQQATTAANQQALQATAAAQAWNAQAQALGLTQDQANEAAALGLTPQEYAQGVIPSQVMQNQSGFPSVDPLNYPNTNPQNALPPPLDPTYTTSGNLLQWYGPGF